MIAGYFIHAYAAFMFGIVIIAFGCFTYSTFENRAAKLKKKKPSAIWAILIAAIFGFAMVTLYLKGHNYSALGVTVVSYAVVFHYLAKWC